MAFPEKFIEIEPLVPGRNAKVFKAVNSFVGRKVFLKIYPIPEEDSLSALREPQLICELEHQNLVKIFGADVLEDRQLLLEMELIQEGSFDDIINKNGIDMGGLPSVQEVLRLILGVASGLSHLHSKGYVHRDIKPANLLMRRIGDRCEGVVTDLGLASKFDESGRAFASEHARIYRPPEVCQGMGYSASSDIYQLGIVLFQLLGGKIDYAISNMSDENMIKEIVSNGIMDIDSIGPHADDKLCRLIRQCVCSEKDRIASIADLVVKLQNIKVNHLDWTYLVREKGFLLERKDIKETIYRVSVEKNDRDHLITLHKQIKGGKLRAYGQPQNLVHKNIARCQKFRKLIEFRSN